MFRTYYFSEMPYPYTPTLEFAEVARTTMPTRWFDPDAAHDVYHKYFDLVLAADDIGLDVMFNEHHETMSNMDAAMPLSMAIAARETRRAPHSRPGQSGRQSAGPGPGGRRRWP